MQYISSPPPIDNAALNRALRDSTIVYKHTEGECRPHVTEAYSIAPVLKSIEDIIQVLLADDRPVFAIKARKGAAQVSSSRLSETLLYILKTDGEIIRSQFPVYVFHPYVEVFMRLAKQFDLYRWTFIYDSLSQDEVVEAAHRFNSMCRALRQECKGSAFKNKLKGHLALVRKNQKSLRRYIDALFDVHARLLVIRVDLSYLKHEGAAKDWKLAKEHRKQLIVAINRDLPMLLTPEASSASIKRAKRPIGYVLCAEHGADAGWHFHLALFVNGNESCHSVNIAGLIGDYWSTTITQGAGRYYNCNYHRAQYKRMGIGDVHWSDGVKRYALQECIAYFAKADYYGKAFIEGNERFLCRGTIPKQKKKAGRPRTARVEASAAPITLPGLRRVAMPLRSEIFEADVPF